MGGLFLAVMSSYTNPCKSQTKSWRPLISGVVAIELWQVKQLYSMNARIAVLNELVKAPVEIREDLETRFITRGQLPLRTVKKPRFFLSPFFVLPFVLLWALLLLCSGCSWLQKVHPGLTAQTSVEWRTNTIVQLITNTVAQPVYVTNTTVQAGVPVVTVQTNFVTQQQIVQVPVSVPYPYTNTIYLPSGSVTNAIGTIETLAPLVPGYGGLIGSLAGILGAGFGLYARAMNGQSKQVVTAIVAGVEAAAGPDVKQAIQSHATAAGIQHILDPIVQAVSAKMPDTGPTVAGLPI